MTENIKNNVIEEVLLSFKDRLLNLLGIPERIDFIEDNFKFPVASYIYKSVSDFTNEELIKVFNCISKDCISVMEYDDIKFKNKKFETNIIEYDGKKIIFEGFKYDSSPSFIKNKDYNENRYGYILIVTIKNYIFIQKSGGTKNLDKYFFNKLKESKIHLSKVKKDEISKLIHYKGYTNIVSLDLQNTKNSKKEVDKMKISGLDLISAVNKSDVGNYRDISMNIKNNDIGLNLNKNTSRLQFTGEKDITTSFKKLLGFYSDLKDILLGSKTNNTILSEDIVGFTEKTFVQTYTIEEKESFIPKFIGFDIGEIKKEISILENDDSSQTYDDEKNSIIYLYDLFEVINENGENKFSINLGTQNIKVNINKENNNLELEDNNLIKIIDRISAYTIYGEIGDKQVIYSNGEYYKSRSFEDINKNIIVNYVLSVFNKDSQKEKEGDNSLFNQIELYYNKEENKPEYLLCTDMGHEISDYIAVTDDELVFIHAKVHNFDKTKEKNNTNSVSAFHIVVSQAIKNLGFISGENKYSKIKESFGGTVKVDGKDKNKILIGNLKNPNEPDKDEIVKFELVLNKTSYKKVVLAINFFQEKYFKDYILDEGGSNKNNYLYIQMLNLLGEFISTCKSRGIKPEIRCKENN